MNNFNIKTTLNICPTAVPPAHKSIYIQKGASAVLNFDFNKEIYSFLDTDQMTFIFKQNNKLYWFKMFTYLVKTEDVEPIKGKTYYTSVSPIEEEALQCTAELVATPEAPKAHGYYEAIEGNCSWRDTLYLVDSHFNHSSGSTWDYVSLILQPNETNKFNVTQPGSEVAFEVAIRLNTDTFNSLNQLDSTIIEPQCPITVVDSLYSKII